MLRLRLASLALASGALFALSGCTSTCESGSLFPRLFPNRSASYAPSSGAECDCHSSFMAPAPTMMGMHSDQGAVMTMPSTASVQQPMPIPITNIPATQPPQLFRVPSAPPTAYVPN